eukprot:scaffold124672_cov54-Phaeocystis_antarctica.AAC.2
METVLWGHDGFAPWWRRESLFARDEGASPRPAASRLGLAAEPGRGAAVPLARRRHRLSRRRLSRHRLSRRLRGVAAHRARHVLRGAGGGCRAGGV